MHTLISTQSFLQYQPDMTSDTPSTPSTLEAVLCPVLWGLDAGKPATVCAGNQYCCGLYGNDCCNMPSHEVEGDVRSALWMFFYVLIGFLLLFLLFQILFCCLLRLYMERGDFSLTSRRPDYGSTTSP